MSFATFGSTWTSIAALVLGDGLSGAIIRTTAVLAAAGLVSVAAWRASSAARHLVWLVGFVGVLAVTVLSFGGLTIPVRMPQYAVAVMPAVRVVFPTSDVVVAPEEISHVHPPGHVAVAGPRVMRITREVLRALDGIPLLPIVWFLGCLFVLGRCVFGHLTLQRIIARGRPLATPEWQRALFDAAGAVDLSRPVRLFVSHDVQSPITSGVVRPVVILPSDAESWDSERRHIVLLHELAHVARGDYASQLLAAIVCALFWFNPFVWIAATRLRVEAEHAADDAVLVAGTSGVTYATHLLELARQERSLHLAAAVAVGMIRSTRLEGRFRAMLDSTRPRARVTPAMFAVATLLALLVFIPLGALRVSAGAMTSDEAFAIQVADIGPPVVASVPAVAVVGAVPVIASATEVPMTAAVSAIHEVPALPEARVISTPAPVTVTQVIAQARGAVDSTFEKTIAAASGDRLKLDLRTGGNIILHGWNQPRVRLRARLAGRDWRETEVKLERVGREVRLDAGIDRSGGTSTSHTFEMWVPRSTDVEIASAGGAISIDNLNGEFTGYSGGGGITIVSSSGSARLTTGGGDIRVSNSDLGGTVSTGGGEVLISDVTGGLRMSSGSGPVVTALPSESGIGTGAGVRGGVGQGVGGTRGAITASGSGVSSSVSGGVASTTTTIDGAGIRGQIGNRGITTTTYRDIREQGVTPTRGFVAGSTSITKAGGEIELDEMLRGGVVRTGGGRIYIGESRGLLDVSTGGGDIELAKMGGDALVSTGAGDITIRVINVDGNEHTVSVHSGKGRVVLEVPANLDARLELETAYTENFNRRTQIESDIGLALTETQDWDDRFGTPRKFVRGTATVGNGRGVIRVSTVNGDIIVRRR